MEYMEYMQEHGLRPTETREQTALPHPWRRYLARTLDGSIYALIWLTAQYILLRWQPENNVIVNLLISYIELTLMIFIEPLLLSTWGTTPGKAIFGLRLRTGAGEKLTYREALSRTFVMFARGYGYGIPIYNIGRGLKCKKASLNGETMEWDEGLDYQLLDTRPVRAFGYAGAVCALLFLAFFVSLQGQMPLHRAPLSPAQYVENVNDVLTRPDMYTGERMEENGRWRAEEYDGTIWFMGAGLSADHELTVENGEVTGVRFCIDSQEDWISAPGGMQKLYMLLAFFAAQREVDCFTMNFGRELKEVLLSTESFDTTIKGVHMSQTVEQSGYSEMEGYFFAEEGGEHSFRMTFAMEQAK